MNNDTNIEDLWQQEGDIIGKITSDGLDKYVKELPMYKEIFSLEDRCLRCIDEGTQGGLHLAGSGILLDMATAKRYASQAGVTGVYSHDECGAAKLYAVNEKLDPEFSDEFGIEWAKMLAENLGVPYKGHIGINAMARPSGFHTARVSYYDGTGQFDGAKLNELPNGFVINRKYLDPDYAQKELAVSLSIAFGNHGFGHKFTPSTPFLILIFATNPEELLVLTAEAKAAAAEYGSRVKIEGMLAVTS
ncbi:MAG: hypothetical protein BWY68_00072 [bacterium ADurb.Bin400]|nr:MAG: hypothetical protein BWY68_00072 [bacterium ADurb.Bin400]